MGPRNGVWEWDWWAILWADVPQISQPGNEVYLTIASLGLRPKTNPSADCFQYYVHIGSDTGTRGLVTRLSYSLRLCLATRKLACMGMRLGGYTWSSTKEHAPPVCHHFCSPRLIHFHIAGGWKLVSVLGWLGMSTPLLESPVDFSRPSIMHLLDFRWSPNGFSWNDGVLISAFSG